MPTVRIPTPLRKLTGGLEEVQATGANLGEVLQALEKTYPGFKERIFDEAGEIRRFINVFVNDEDVRFLQNLKTPVKDGDEISILPAIAGGGPDKKRVYLTYPPQLVREPIIYNVGRRFHVVTNLGSATVSNGIGVVALELEGENGEIGKAVEYLQGLGIKVDPIEQNVVE
ncbi:MAG: MoaD family protein [Nitrospirae bacterium]|nr:MoaD family protein [Nitrospirota bacterium]